MLLAICCASLDRCLLFQCSGVFRFSFSYGLHVCAVVDRCAIASAQILSQMCGCAALISSQSALFSQWNSITDGFGLLEQVRGIPCTAFSLQFCGLRAVAFHY